MLTRVAHDKALPFEPLIPNEVTIAAMKEARERKLETVTLDDLQAVIDAND
jgi:DNA-damage-inducible protein J